MTSRQPEQPASCSMLTLTAGTTTIGFVLSRGKAGFELFDHNEKTLGVFPSLHAAVAAIPRTAEERR
jgi:hypothetical protein